MHKLCTFTNCHCAVVNLGLQGKLSESSTAGLFPDVHWINRGTAIDLAFLIDALLDQSSIQKIHGIDFIAFEIVTMQHYSSTVGI